MAYTPNIIFGSSSTQFYLTLPNSSDLPSNDSYWAVVKEEPLATFLVAIPEQAQLAELLKGIK